jgi:hypothetical protein
MRGEFLRAIQQFLRLRVRAASRTDSASKLVIYSFACCDLDHGGNIADTLFYKRLSGRAFGSAIAPAQREENE